jgi:hypothetical protein
MKFRVLKHHSSSIDLNIWIVGNLVNFMNSLNWFNKSSLDDNLTHNLVNKFLIKQWIHCFFYMFFHGHFELKYLDI